MPSRRGRVPDSANLGLETNNKADLQGLLMGGENNDTIPVDNIRVLAPYDLPAGYELETVANGQRMLVVVPRGGVKAGDEFQPASASLDKNALHDISISRRNGSSSPTSGGQKGGAPVGAWRDSQWDCCKLGCCHPSLWNSIVCPLLAAGQVITRLQLTWFGRRANSVAQVAIAFQVIIMILVAYWATRVFLFLIIAYLDPNTDPDRTEFIDPSATYFFFAAFDDFLSYMYFALVIIVIRNVRSHVRRKYAIPEGESTCCPGCEDLCCSMFCPCLVAAHMMRHTADYEQQRAVCCNNTGLAEFEHEGSTNGGDSNGGLV